MRRIDQFRQLLAQDVKLLLVQDFDARQVPMLAIEGNLFLTQAISLPVVTGKQRGERL
jgi:hypothetical protein